MAYDPSLLSEQLRRQDTAPVGWPWQLFTLSIIALIMTVVVYLGIKVGYIPYLNSRISTEEAKIEEFGRSVSDTQKAELIAFYSQLVNAESLLENHIINSKFFDSLEANTHEAVYLTDLNFSSKDGSARISGVAPDFDTLAAQLDLFGKMSGAIRVSLDNAQQQATAGVGFSALIVFNTEMFRN